MISQTIRITISLTLIWLCISSTVSQNIDINFLDELEGLSHNTQYYPNSIYEDKFGRIWIATLDGLNIYDGEEIRLFDIKTEEGAFPLRYVLTLAEGPEGRLWIATQHNGVFIYDIDSESLERFTSDTHYPHLEQDIEAFGFFIDRQERFLISSLHVIYEYDPVRRELITAYEYPKKSTFLSDFKYLDNGQLMLTTQNDISILKDDGSVRYVFSGDILYSFINSDGRIKVVQNDATQFIWDPTLDTFTKKTPVDCKMPCKQFRFDSLYIKSERGKLTILDYYTDEQISIIAEVEVPTLVSAIRNQTGEIYYMSYNLGAGKVSMIQSPFEPLANHGVLALKKHEGQIYASTAEEGIFKVEDSLSLSLELSDILHFEMLDDGHIMINQSIDYRGYTSLFSPNHKRIKGPLRTNTLDQIVQLRNGEILLNTTYYVEDKIDAQYIGDYISENTSYDFSEFRVRYFMETMAGELWLFKYGEGILKISIESDTVIDPLIVKDNANPVGVYGAYYGYEGSDSTVYIAAENGLFAYHNDSWTKLSLPGQDKHLSVTGIAEDLNKNIWFMGRTRLYRLDVDTQEIHYFILPELLRPATGHPADMLAGDDGLIYYRSSYYGVSRFDPESLISQPPPNSVLITDLYIDQSRVTVRDDYNILNSTIMSSEDLTLSYDYRDVGFRYASINADATDCTYHYRLVGYDDEWKNEYGENSHYYTNLDPGDYTFEVKAQASGGKWTEDITQVSFTIIPPWYRTYWAYAAYLILCLMVAYGYYRYRIYQLMKYQRLRTKISSDLHDDVGSLLSAVAMQSEVLGLDAPPESIAKFDKLSRLSREAMGRMRDTVWAIDARKDNVESLVERMEDYLSDILDADVPKLRYSFDKSISNMTLRIAPDIRQNVYLIFKEAVNNAVKHSNGDLLQISLSSTASEIDMQIADNGTVNPEQIKSSGLGLSNMKMRAERIGAELQIEWSNGAKINLRVSL